MAISSDLLAQLNAVNCGAKAVLGTGTNNCPFNRKRPIAALLTQHGFELEEALSLAYLQELQMRKIGIVLGKVVNFTDQTAEDSINTYDSSRIKTINGKSPYEYMLQFDNGLYFHKAVNSLESFGNYDCIYFDEDMNILFTATADYAKGFTLGQIGVMPYQGANGNSPSSQRVWWQELYRSEFDEEAAWITKDNHNIRPVHLDGINDIVLEFTVAPSNGDTTIKFTAKTKADVKNINVGGLLPADLLFTVDGSSVTLTNVTVDSNGEYTGTFASALATAEVVSLKTNNTTYSTAVILKGGKLYESNVLTATVIV